MFEEGLADSCEDKLLPAECKEPDTMALPDIAPWTDELLQKYGQMPLPSLYDYLLSQEKLAAEIRRQNRAIQASREDFASLQKSVANLQALLEERLQTVDCEENSNKTQEEYDEQLSSDDADNDVDLADQWKRAADLSEIQKVFMHTMDMLLNLFEATQVTTSQLEKLVPQGKGFWRTNKPAWRHQFEITLEGYVNGVALIKDKLLVAFADINVEVIIPQIGEDFNPHLHRAVENINSGKNRKIAKVIRYGYCRGEELLRYADVAVN